MAMPSPFEPLWPPAAAGVGRPFGLRREADSWTQRFDLPPIEPVDGPVTAQGSAATDPPPPPPPTFSQAELAEAVDRARDEGRAEAEARVRAEMTRSIEQRASAASAAIARELSLSRDGHERRLAARAGASAELAIAIARAIVPRALQGRPLADIESMLVDLVRRLEGQPRLDLTLAPDVVVSGEALLRRIAEEVGHGGEISVHGDARLDVGDVRLGWNDGVAERDLAALRREVEAVVETWLPAAPGFAPEAADLDAPDAADHDEQVAGATAQAEEIER